MWFVEQGGKPAEAALTGGGGGGDTGKQPLTTLAYWRFVSIV